MLLLLLSEYLWHVDQRSGQSWWRRWDKAEAEAGLYIRRKMENLVSLTNFSLKLLSVYLSCQSKGHLFTILQPMSLAFLLVFNSKCFWIKIGILIELRGMLFVYVCAHLSVKPIQTVCDSIAVFRWFSRVKMEKNGCLSYFWATLYNVQTPFLNPDVRTPLWWRGFHQQNIYNLAALWREYSLLIHLFPLKWGWANSGPPCTGWHKISASLSNFPPFF